MILTFLLIFPFLSHAFGTAKPTGNPFSPSSSSPSTACSSTTSSSEETTKSFISKENLDLLSSEGKSALLNLIEFDQSSDNPCQHDVYGSWPDVGTKDNLKINLANQIAELDSSYPGGLKSYITKARKLLQESKLGTNPFEEYAPTVPEGERLCYENKLTNMSFSEAEQAGLQGIGDVAFVIVAGGLGERLGYSGIKLSLETNLCTNKSYLEVYVKYILAMQRLAIKKLNREDVQIPLVIMTSGDTDEPTRQILKENNNFGMTENQILIVTQAKVPALQDSDAKLAFNAEKFQIETKPHGHGDVHQLLKKHGIVEDWIKQGRKHVIFLQDTNVLVINSVLPTLGVSITKQFDMNTICTPRVAGEAAGAITSLNHKTDPSKSLVINVEYNQLGPLLKSVNGEGDIADEATGYSPYPGNSNILIMGLSSYNTVLNGEDEGVVTEFVNPKYKKDNPDEFLKPTRLECMMQDFPKLMQKELGNTVNVGFTMFERWFTFSPAKNSLESGQTANPPDTASSAESDKYIQNQRKLRHVGMDVPVTEHADDFLKIAGIPVTPGPRIVICPAFSITQEELQAKIQGGSVTKRSSLVLEGENLKINNLNLDGALVIRTGKDCDVTVQDLTVQNKGWELRELEDGVDYPEHVKIRGYVMEKHEAMEILIQEPGKYAVDKNGIVTKIE